jgi:hypothetical protein
MVLSRGVTYRLRLINMGADFAANYPARQQRAPCYLAGHRQRRGHCSERDW